MATWKRLTSTDRHETYVNIEQIAYMQRDEGHTAVTFIRSHRSNAVAVLCAFDLIEVNGEDLRREMIEDRKRRLAGLLRLPHDGIALNETFTGDGSTIYRHACALGCEGIVSKRMGSPYRAGRSAHWLKIKNPEAPAVKREARRSGGRMGKQVFAEIVSVPASESETGHDEIYVVFDGKRIAKRAGTAYAGTWVSIEPGFEVVVDDGELMVLQNTDPPSIH